MKISVITVCYNSIETLETTILSVKKQTHPNIEYIIVDGKSEDGSLDIIKKHESVISKWVSEPDTGLYDAMNKGLKMATGDIIALINSDDLFCDDKALEKVAIAFVNRPDLDCIYADLYYVSQNDTDEIIRTWRTGGQRKFKYGWHPAHPTFYVKKDVYNRFGGFNLDFKLAADFEIMLRFLEKHQISAFYLEESLVKMRLGGATNQSFKNIKKGNIECINAFKINSLPVNKLLYPFYRIIPKLIQFFH